MVEGTTATETDDVSPTCSDEDGGRDVVFSWVAPEDACYTFETTGSEFDTVLGIHAPCSGELIECDDDGSEHPTSKIERYFGEGRELLLVLDGYYSDSYGDYEFSITSGEILEYVPDGDLGSATGEVMSGSTEDESDDYDPSCGSTGASDLSYLWTPPSSGCYRIDTEGSDFDTTLTVLSYVEGPTCTTAEELECDDDGGSSTLSSLEYTATGSEPVLIIVDGYRGGDDGDFELNISLCPDP